METSPLPSMFCGGSRAARHGPGGAVVRLHSSIVTIPSVAGMNETRYPGIGLILRYEIKYLT
ncbi:hypothetical protein ACVWZ8_002595 [Arthrobacter sp. UYCu723]